MFVLRRRAASWAVLGVLSVVWVGVQVVAPEATVPVVAGLAAVVVAVGLWRDRGRELWLQTLGFALFCTVAVVGLVVAPVLAALLLGVGWICHGAWDLWHLRRDAVVSRSLAEWCAVFDVLVGGLLVVSVF